MEAPSVIVAHLPRVELRGTLFGTLDLYGHRPRGMPRGELEQARVSSKQRRYTRAQVASEGVASKARGWGGDQGSARTMSEMPAGRS